MVNINLWRNDLILNGKSYDVSKRMRIRNKITALISREKNREKIDFLENQIQEEDQKIEEVMKQVQEVLHKFENSESILQDIETKLKDLNPVFY